MLKIIKRRASVRKYLKKNIPLSIVRKILQAGIWGPAVPSFLGIQPWKFYVVRRKSIIFKLSNIIFDVSKKETIGVNVLLKSSSNIIRNADTIVLVSKTDEFLTIKKRFPLIFEKFSEIIFKAQDSAIAASIQNMILCAESLNIGSCWLDTPLICSEEICNLFGIKEELFAVLTFGYPEIKGKRTKRKLYSEVVEVVR